MIKSRLSSSAEGDALRQAKALDDVEAGQLVPNDEICAWLESWGTPVEEPPAEIVVQIVRTRGAAA